MCSYLSDGQDVNKVFEALSPVLTGAWPDIHTFGGCSPVDIEHVCAVRTVCRMSQFTAILGRISGG